MNNHKQATGFETVEPSERPGQITARLGLWGPPGDEFGKPSVEANLCGAFRPFSGGSVFTAVGFVVLLEPESHEEAFLLQDTTFGIAFSHSANLLSKTDGVSTMRFDYSLFVDVPTSELSQDLTMDATPVSSSQSQPAFDGQ